MSSWGMGSSRFPLVPLPSSWHLVCSQSTFSKRATYMTRGSGWNRTGVGHGECQNSNFTDDRDSTRRQKWCLHSSQNSLTRPSSNTFRSFPNTGARPHALDAHSNSPEACLKQPIRWPQVYFRGWRNESRENQENESVLKIRLCHFS